jgi:hypothetical protein
MIENESKSFIRDDKINADRFLLYPSIITYIKHTTRTLY